MKSNYITMSAKELDQIYRFEKLKDALLTQCQVACALGMSLRQIKPKFKRYKQEGKTSLTHKSRGRKSNRRIPAKVVQKAMNLISKCYSDFGPTLASEMLQERHGITIHPETLLLYLIRYDIWSKKPRKLKHHLWRERRDCPGELVQLDGSEHDWFE